MKGRYVLLLAAVVGLVVVIAFYAAYPVLNSTKISTIMSDASKYNGKQVGVFGQVVHRFSNGFMLNDGTGTILVLWNGELPAVGTNNVYVVGAVTGGGISIDGLEISGAYITASSVSVWPFE